MIAPQVLPEQALRRLRRRYAWLMLALAVPVLAAVFYVLALQYQLAWAGMQRQWAMSAEQRLTGLDAVLGRMREDLLRLGYAVRSPGLLGGGLQADKRALRPAGPEVYTLDELPVLLHDRSPQVILVGAGWADVRRRDTAVENAAHFAEQGRLAMLRGGRFFRVTYLDAEAGEAWIFPWLDSAQWRAEMGAPTLAQALAGASRRAAPAQPAALPVEEVRWALHAARGAAASASQVVVLVTPITPGAQRPLLIAEAHPQALIDARADRRAGRFWVVDGRGQVVVDEGADTRTDGAGAARPSLAPAQLASSLGAMLAQEVGGSIVAVRRSTVAPWTALYANDRAELRRRVLRNLWPYLAGGVLLLMLFTAIAAFVWRHFGEPSLRLVDYLRRQSADSNAPAPAVPSQWLPWLRLTRETFAAWRAAAARELRSEALKSAIVDHALAAVVTTDAAGVIVEFNPAAERMFGRPREAVLGRAAAGLIVPAGLLAAYLDDLRRLHHGEAAQLVGRRMEANALRADGSEFPVDIVLWRTRVGAETFHTASMFDLTERHAAAREIEHQREKLRQAEKLSAMGTLLAGVAHELNNPLAIVMGRARLLEDSCTDPAQRAHAASLREAADRCGRIVRAFLAMARQQPAQRSMVQVNDLVRGALELLQYNQRSAGIELELRLRDAAPRVWADADQLGQLLLNLLVNAQQALAAVPAPRRLRVEVGGGDQWLWVRVSDNGKGVPEAQRERIFDAYVTTKPEGAGTGLGLALARSVALEHGGRLLLENDSPFGRGASFRLELPLSQQTLPAAAATPLPDPPADLAPCTAAADAALPLSRVLVVDDEPELLVMMRDALERAGHEVASAESAPLALALLDEGRFDAVVCDLRMPEMDGPTLWRAVRARHAQLAARFVFVTGDILSPQIDLLRRESGAVVVEKPFVAAELVQHVQHCLRRAWHEAPAMAPPRSTS